jgi:hypothetical protein
MTVQYAGGKNSMPCMGVALNGFCEARNGHGDCSISAWRAF